MSPARTTRGAWWEEGRSIHREFQTAAGRAGNCTACRLKRVFLAYRVLCDPCARESKMCPGCNKPPAQAELAEGEGEAEEEEGAGEESDSEDDLAELEAAGVVITRN